MNWSSDFAYCVGLIATDGNLSKDGRHIDFTSKDLEQVMNFKRIIKPDVNVGHKKSLDGTKYPNIQFSDVKLYRFLVSIGLYPNKSKTLRQINVPNELFADFLRGCFDGDGHSYSYWDKRWRSSFMLYIGFSSASLVFIQWLKTKIFEQFNIVGNIKGKGSVLQLMYAKNNSKVLAQKMYYSNSITCLSRKRCKLDLALGIISKQAGVEKLVYSLP